MYHSSAASVTVSKFSFFESPLYGDYLLIVQKGKIKNLLSNQTQQLVEGRGEHKDSENICIILLFQL